MFTDFGSSGRANAQKKSHALVVSYDEKVSRSDADINLKYEDLGSTKIAIHNINVRNDHEAPSR
jgi:hypothetical protein